MIPLTTLHLVHLPPDLAIHIALCQELTNAAFLRQQLLDGNAEFEYAMLDAAAILSPTHLHAAIFRAAIDQHAGRLKSRNVHSEIVFALSPNNNIADSFRRFGLTATTIDLIIVKLGTGADRSAEEAQSAEAVGRHLEANVQGTWARFGQESCAALGDVGRIGKGYKLGVGVRGGGKSGEGGGKGEEREREERAEMEVAILGLMALRGAS